MKSPLLLRSRPNKLVCILSNKGEFSVRSANGISQSHRFAQTDEVLLGNLQNLKLHESFEEHASASLKRSASSDEIQAVNEASERPLEV